jgi:hypothetical protein
MGVVRIFWVLFDVVRFHRKLVHFGRRNVMFFAWRKSPQAGKQTSYKSRVRLNPRSKPRSCRVVLIKRANWKSPNGRERPVRRFALWRLQEPCPQSLIKSQKVPACLQRQEV